jgi:hypothetical protein
VTTQSLDGEIIDVGGLISVLLVFVFAYFSALLPIFEDLRHRSKPPALDDREALVRRLFSYRLLACGLFAIVILVLGLLGPLSWQVLDSQPWKPFRTVRVGLLLVDGLLLATGVGILAEVVLLTRRARELR